MTSGSGRRLRDDEHKLWSDVTRSIRPIRPPSKPASDTKESVSTQPKAVGRARPSAYLQPAKSKPVLLPAPAPLGRRMKQRLARGTEQIDARLDLHGRTQAQAHSALLRFLRTAQDRGARNVLVITGKGARAGESERGVLKRQVPMWLQLPEFRVLVVGFEDAHVGHGGEGALYIRVRRPKE